MKIMYLFVYLISYFIVEIVVVVVLVKFFGSFMAWKTLLVLLDILIQVGR